MTYTSDTANLRIGELAAELGINPKTIRYYEEIGLLPPAKRGDNGYRHYDETDREWLHFIAKAKTVGLTLEEIGEILALRREGTQPCERVLDLLDHKLMTVAEQLRTLTDFQQDILTLRQAAYKTMHANACVCGIIEQHEQAEDHTKV